MEGLKTMGHDQKLVAWPGGPLAEKARHGGLDVAGVPIRGDVDMAAMVRIMMRARTWGAEIVHAHTAHAHAAAMIAAKLAGVKGRVVTRRVVLPVGQNPWSRAKYKDREIRYVAISEAVADALIEGGVDPDRIRVVYSGVPNEGVPQASDGAARLRARNMLNLRADVPVIGIVGALTREKGQDSAVKALPELPGELRLVLIGDGPERKNLEELARSLGVRDRVVFAGFRPETGDLWPAFDLALAPSRHEGLGTAVLEAMAAGVPVVASSIGAFRHVLRDGAVGMLVEPENEKGMARAVAGLMGDRETRSSMARAGLDRVKDYSTENMVRGTEAVYTDLEV